VLTKTCKILQYLYNKCRPVFIVTYFIALCLKEILVSACRIWRDNSPKLVAAVLMIVGPSYRIVHLLMLHVLFMATTVF